MYEIKLDSASLPGLVAVRGSEDFGRALQAWDATRENAICTAALILYVADVACYLKSSCCSNFD